MSDDAKKDLAQSFQTMMGLSAWKHFELILDHVESQATKDEDAIATDQLNLATIGECRGRRNAVKKIKSDLGYILEGLK